MAAIWDSLSLGGAAFIADYAKQFRALDRLLFRATVQLLDGVTDTQPNADGALEQIIKDITGTRPALVDQVATATGRISIFKFQKF